MFVFNLVCHECIIDRVFFFRDMHAVITLIRAYATCEIDFSIVFYSGPRDLQWVMSKTNYRLYVNKLNPCFHDKKPSRIKDFFEFTVEGTGALFVSLEQFWNKKPFSKTKSTDLSFFCPRRRSSRANSRSLETWAWPWNFRASSCSRAKPSCERRSFTWAAPAGAPPTLALISVAARASGSAL